MQLIVSNSQAETHPISGAFKHTGNDEQDAELAKQLAIGEKKMPNT